MHLGAHRALRSLEGTRDLRRLQALLQVETQHRAIQLGQRRDRVRHRAEEFVALGVARRIDGVVVRRPARVERAPTLATRGARMVAEDPDQPRQHRLAGPVRLARFDRGDERRLHEVFGASLTRRQVPRQLQQLCRCVIEHPRQGARVARALVEREGLVGGAAEHQWGLDRKPRERCVGDRILPMPRGCLAPRGRLPGRRAAGLAATASARAPKRIEPLPASRCDDALRDLPHPRAAS